MKSPSVFYELFYKNNMSLELWYNRNISDNNEMPREMQINFN